MVLFILFTSNSGILSSDVTKLLLFTKPSEKQMGGKKLTNDFKSICLPKNWNVKIMGDDPET